MCMTAGGDSLDYDGITAIQMTSLATTKCLINTILSTQRAKFMSADIRDYCYRTVLDRFKYMHMALKDIPDKIIVQYNLKDIASKG